MLTHTHTHPLGNFGGKSIWPKAVNPKMKNQIHQSINRPLIMLHIDIDLAINQATTCIKLRAKIEHATTQKKTYSYTIQFIQ